MAQTVLASEIIAAARQLADAETPTPSEDHVTDTELLAVLNRAYREYLDEIISTGDAALELLAVSATVNAPSYTLPVDFYRLLGVDAPAAAGGRPRALQTRSWRNRYQYGSPGYRLVGGALVVDTGDLTAVPPPTLTVWYIPAQPDLVAGDPALSWNGWHDALVARVARYIAIKEDRETTAYDSEWTLAMTRVKAAVQSTNLSDTQTIARVECYAEDMFDWRW